MFDPQKTLKELYDEKIISGMIYNSLSFADINTVGDIIARSDKDLLKNYGFGRTGLREVRRLFGASTHKVDHIQKWRSAVIAGHTLLGFDEWWAENGAAVMKK